MENSEVSSRTEDFDMLPTAPDNSENNHDVLYNFYSNECKEEVTSIIDSCLSDTANDKKNGVIHVEEYSCKIEQSCVNIHEKPAADSDNTGQLYGDQINVCPKNKNNQNIDCERISNVHVSEQSSNDEITFPVKIKKEPNEYDESRRIGCKRERENLGGSMENIVIKQEYVDGKSQNNSETAVKEEICMYCLKDKSNYKKSETNNKVSFKRSRSNQKLRHDSKNDEEKACTCCLESKSSRSTKDSSKSSEDIQRRGSLSSVSDTSENSQSVSEGPVRNIRKKRKGEAYESDPVVLARRQKQINYGKNTIGYQRYQELVPRYQRTRQDPETPPKHVKYSRRGWDGLIKSWRRRLHDYDPPKTDGAKDDSSLVSSSPVPTVSDDSELLMDTESDVDNKSFVWANDVEDALLDE